MKNYFNLGAHQRPVTTSSPAAQLWFDRGLNWCFGFNQEEGVKCFHKALEYDPACAMAYWGMAYAAGPFYNMPWRDFCAEEIAECTRFCYDNIATARTLVAGISTVEADLIHALATRFQADHGVTLKEFDAWDDAYADAMRQVYQNYPEDLDVAAIFVEAMMTRTPWKLWDVKSGQPAAGADTLECLAVLDKAIALADIKGIPQHPAILHLHIHCLEMSPWPDSAMDSANVLGTLCPDAGHMAHMPGHIYVLCGLYEQAKTASERAIQADRKYLEYAGPYNFYTTARCHDLHLMMYTCMLLGQFEPAMQAAQEMCATLSRDVLQVQDRPYLAHTLEGYYSMQMHVLVRFGKWQEIIAAPIPECSILYCVSIAMHHYARGVSHAALGHIDAAERAQSSFYRSLENIPAQRRFFNNHALDILAVAEYMLEGELEYHKGHYQAAYAALETSVRLNDNLAYSEPWAWMHPPRHALGALLTAQGHYEQAEEVYRTDLGLNNKLQRCSQHLDNVWSLHGLAECLHKRGEKDEIVGISRKLALAMEKTDVAISASCCCRPGQQSV